MELKVTQLKVQHVKNKCFLEQDRYMLTISKVNRDPQETHK